MHMPQVLDELKANIEKGLARIKVLEARTLQIMQERDALIKERDELAEDNVKLQVETFQWQDRVMDMRMTLKSARHQQMYPRKSQRIYQNLIMKSKNKK